MGVHLKAGLHGRARHAFDVPPIENQQSSITWFVAVRLPECSSAGAHRAVRHQLDASNRQAIADFRTFC
jgi:hypothetical protein